MNIFQIHKSLEEWLPIKGYERRYEVSNLGNVRSIGKRFRRRGAIVLMPALNGNCYLTIGLTKSGKSKTFSIARLVAEHFIGNPTNKPQVNHINGIKTDNRVENLEWCTSSENNKHAHRTGLRDTHGEGHPSAKLNNYKVFRIRLIKEIQPTLKLKFLAKMFSVTRASINNVHLGRTWSHI